MAALLLLSLLPLALIAGVFGLFDDDGSDSDDPHEPDLPEPDLPEPEDTGVTDEDDAVRLSLGEDETGTMVALKFQEFDFDLSGGGDGTSLERFSLGVYLLPEGTEIPLDADGRGFDDATMRRCDDRGISGRDRRLGNRNL